LKKANLGVALHPAIAAAYWEYALLRGVRAPGSWPFWSAICSAPRN